MLTEEVLKKIKQLKELCEEEDHLELKLNWDMLEKREHHKDDFLYYQDQQLIGFLALYDFGETFELCGMVHPSYRRKGIFRTLFMDAVESLQSRSVKKLLLNTPATSLSGKAFIESVDALYDFSEYQMKWVETTLDTSNQIISLRESTSDEDFNMFIQLDVICFNVSEKDAKQFSETVTSDPNQRSLMIDFQGKTVGKISIQRADDRSYIFGFAVLPEYQGRGFGRQALAQTVAIEKEISPTILLEVATKNANALRLYESQGFQSYQTQDYYYYSL